MPCGSWSFLLRRWDPAMKLAAGGYHPTLMAKELVAADPDLPLDFLIRGEGEATFRDLVNSLADPQPDLARIAGLSYRQEGTWRHNPDRPLLDLATLPLPLPTAQWSDS